MLYEIHESNMPRLLKKLATIENKCSKYGCSFHFEELGEVYRLVRGQKARFITVSAEGVARVNGWEFIGTIQHIKPINAVRAFNTEVDIPERFYTADPVCEHCNSKRVRKDTYIVRNLASGEYKQVGKSCLLDFTGGLSAEAAAQYTSYFDQLEQGKTPTAGFKVYQSTLDVLQYAVEAVQLYGYRKTDSFEQSTVATVREQLFKLTGYQLAVEFNVDRAGNKEKAQTVLAWVDTLNAPMGYLSNLKAVCSKENCEPRDFGLVVSAVAAYDRATEAKRIKEAEKTAEAASEHIGTIGERIQLTVSDVRCITHWYTDFGTTYVYKITDDKGNVYTWKTGKELFEVTIKTLKGTVKDHNLYNGTKQTELTRCTVVS